VNHPIVIAPMDRVHEVPAKGAAIAPYTTAEEVVAALRGEFAAAVLVSDGLPADKLEEVAKAIRAASAPVVEVQSARWDGESHSPVSAACRGVIAGFGLSGVREALRVVSS